MRRIMAILALVIALGSVAGVLAKFDSRYAKAATLSAVEDRLDEKIIQDRMEKLQERMWALEDRWATRFRVQYNRIHDTLDELVHFMTEEARAHYRALQAEYAKLEEQLKEEDDDG